MNFRKERVSMSSQKCKFKGHKMTKTVREFAKCQRKNQYDTEPLAREAAEKLTYSKTHKLSVYLCMFCFKWHLTKKENENHTG